MTDIRARVEQGLAGRYQIERELGRGGMATVFLVRDLKHDRNVALKVLQPEILSSVGSERFQQEIRLAARLQHPHILGVHDSGVIEAQNGQPSVHWFTMPFVEGESLRDRMRRERQLPIDDALRITAEAADALDHAHKQGVVHRDIKPENILLSGNHALVADFGIARALGSDAAITGTGLAIGTPAYMSPEQASGTREIDGRTDVYALGAVLYEMLTGEAPFTGPTAQAIIARALTETPRSVRSTRETVPAAVDQAVTRALARAPADRFATTGEFARAVSGAMEAFRRSGDQPTASMPARRKVPSLTAVFGLGLVLGLGILFAWRRAGSGTGAGGARVIAVLPFENLGSEADQYFADGMTDEIRGRLSAVNGLQVIARGSSNQYKGSSKTPSDIARELGANYLLTATVRWEKSEGGQSRVRVTPELVEIKSGSAPATKWQQPFEAVISDVFKVQADIASRVAAALDVALAAGDREKLTQRPTQNLAAYDAYLQGNEAFNQTDPAGLLTSVGHYGRAVALDSTFLVAWSQLSRANSYLYWLSAPLPTYASAARAAADRTAALNPDASATHLARGDVHRFIDSDWNKAIEQYNLARQVDPQNAEILSQVAFSQQGAGLWEDAVKTLEEGARIDPRSGSVLQRLARTYLWLRRYPESDRATERLISTIPNSPQPYQARVMSRLAQGDREGALAAFAMVPNTVDPTALAAYFGNFWDLYWFLPRESQDLLLRLPPAAFGGDRGGWAIILAQTYLLRGDTARARVYADSARIENDRVLADTPNDDQRNSFQGIAHAILGHKAEAIRYGEHALQITPMSRDAYTGVYLKYLLARTLLIVGEPERAIDQLDSILRLPFYVSKAWLKVDPEWDSLRGNPRFQKLLQ
ncbi:MAG TPA: protein kinase [Gemmatimonadales bacterium]|nr:protein kinase [Gemmatimonadales bacterium]